MPNTRTEHTPGPWAVAKRKARRVTAGGITICNAVLRNQGGPNHKSFMKDEHEAEANANLISAAPELLELLVEADRRIPWESVGLGNEFSDRVEAAIAKARGAA